MPQQKLSIVSYTPDDPSTPPLTVVASHEREKTEREKHPIIAAVSDALPAAGGFAGGIIGGVAGLPGGPLAAGAGAVGGATLGGATTESWRQIIAQYMGFEPVKTTAEVLSGIGTGGLMQGALEIPGQVLPLAATVGARKTGAMLMQSALKPSAGGAKMKDFIRGKVDVPPVVKTLLDEGVNVTPAGLRKVNEVITGVNRDIESAISGSKQVVYPEKVARATDALLADKTNQVAPIADRAAVNDIADQFLSFHGGAPNYPLKPLTVQAAHEIKKGTYKAIGQRSYGEVKGAAVEAEKQLARGLKEGIEEGVRKEGIEIGPMNAREGRLLDAREDLGRRVVTAGNRDPLGLAPIAPDPKDFITLLMTRSPYVKSLVARGLWKEAAIAAGIPGKERAISTAFRLLAMSPAVSHDQKDDQ